MAKYIINHIVNGYKTVDIDNEALTGEENNEIVLVLDNSTSDKLSIYYERVIDILLSRNTLYIVIVGKESKIRKAICNLVINYRNYNIYKVDSKDIVTEEYLGIISDRNPSFDEIQTFVGGDLASYADINIVLMGIDDLVSRGDLEGLKRFIEEHLSSIENFTSVVDYMKKIVDTANSMELINKIDELKSKIKALDERINATEEENKDYKDKNIKLIESDEMNRRELSKLMSKTKELEQQLSSSAPVIQTYSEINTALIKCKTTNIIYFKEISYVTYTNSLVMMLAKIIGLMKKRVKLIIYDNKVGMANVYKPLNVINGNDFVANKQNFIANVESFVVIEPNPTILTSILESINPVFDVVIIYDRMRQLTNLVTGNNVVRFHIINSNKDFKEVQSQLRIADKSTIITHAGSSIGKDTLNIPTIPDYNSEGTTEAAKISRYRKLQVEGGTKQIIPTILDKARIK